MEQLRWRNGDGGAYSFFQVNKFREGGYFSMIVLPTVTANKENILFKQNQITKHNIYWVHHEQIVSKEIMFSF